MLFIIDILQQSKFNVFLICNTNLYTVVVIIVSGKVHIPALYLNHLPCKTRIAANGAAFKPAL